MSDSEDDALLQDPEERGIEEVTWIPARLPVTEGRMLQTANDAATLGSTRCLLCLYANFETECGPKMKEIYEFEAAHRRNMQPDELFKGIANKFNDELIAHRQQFLGDRDARKITVPEVRRHFSANHDRDIRRMLEEKMDYLESTSVALEEGGLWERNLNDPTMPLRPNRQNIVTYINVIKQMDALFNRLQNKNSLAATSGVGKRKRGLPIKRG